MKNDYYNTETAKYTKDPEILTNILKRGNNDNVSEYAARNKNCPQDILIEILKKGNNDGNNHGVACAAAKNPNCPPDALAEVLKKENDDYVSNSTAKNPNYLPCPPNWPNWVAYAAVKNPNCPPEILVEILKRGDDEFISICAASNPNCPPKEKIEWMKLTGQIEQYDPNNPNHFIDEIPEEVDEDLEKLKNMI